MANVRIDLALEPHAPTLAREQIRASTEDVEPRVVEDVLVIVTEAISNALHRRAERQPDEQVEVRLSTAPSRINGEIRDGRLGFDVSMGDFDSKVGPGLYVIDHFATRWGLEFGEGARLWFEVGSDPPRD